MVEVPKELVSAALGAAATAAGKEVIGAVLVPAAKEVGDLVRRAVHVGLAPIRAGLWPIEKVIEWAEEEIPKRLRGVPPERIQPPAPETVVPALLAMTYTKAEELRSMFANLLAKSMDSATAGDVHPSFVEVIKQMTPDEAKILAAIGDGADFYLARTMALKPEDEKILVDSETDLFERAGCRRGDNRVSIGNLERQNLVSFTTHDVVGFSSSPLDPSIVPPILMAPLQSADLHGLSVQVYHNQLRPTAFGERFRACCITSAPTASPET